jgi:hypothetical protein
MSISRFRVFAGRRSRRERSARLALAVQGVILGRFAVPRHAVEKVSPEPSCKWMTTTRAGPLILTSAVRGSEREGGPNCRTAGRLRGAMRNETDSRGPSPVRAMTRRAQVFILNPRRRGDCDERIERRAEDRAASRGHGCECAHAGHDRRPGGRCRVRPRPRLRHHPPGGRPASAAAHQAARRASPRDRPGMCGGLRGAG